MGTVNLFVCNLGWHDTQSSCTSQRVLFPLVSAIPFHRHVVVEYVCDLTTALQHSKTLLNRRQSHHTCTHIINQPSLLCTMPSFILHVLCKLLSWLTLTLVPFNTCQSWFPSLSSGQSAFLSAEATDNTGQQPPITRTLQVIFNCVRQDSFPAVNPGAGGLVFGSIELVSDSQSNCQLTTGHVALPDQVVCSGTQIEVDVNCPMADHVLIYGFGVSGSGGTTLDFEVQPGSAVQSHWYRNVQMNAWNSLPSDCTELNSVVTCVFYGVTSGAQMFAIVYS